MIGAYQFLKKYGVAIGFGLGTLVAILTWIIILSGYPDGNPTLEELNKNHSGIFDFGLYATQVLLYIAIAVALIAPAIYMAKNIKESVRVLIGVGVILVLFLITYFVMGDGTMTAELLKSDETLITSQQLDNFQAGKTQSSSLQLADGLIQLGYIMLAGAAILMLVAAVRDFFK